jgi:8-oxo-dGTP diphosphatase
MAPSREHPPGAVTVDLVVLTIRSGLFSVLLIRRGLPPYKGRWALPGGFIQPDEDLLAAARRELAEEAGLVDLPVHLEQLASYGTPGRDPRLRVVTVAHLAIGPDLPDPVAGSDAASASWVPVAQALGTRPGLAFDHRAILTDGIERARAKLEYSPLATSFCGPTFTVSELRNVYECVWGESLDPRNFHRKVTSVDGFLVPVGETTQSGRGRPAQLYRPGPAELLTPPMLRSGSGASLSTDQ